MPFLRALAGSLIALTFTVGVCDAKSKKHVSDDDNQSAEQGDAGDDGSSDTDDKPSADQGQKGKSFSNTKNSAATFGVPRGESLSNKGNGAAGQPTEQPSRAPVQKVPSQPKKPAVDRSN